MYWYDPTKRTSERVEAPRTEEEAVEMLAGDPDSVAFVSEYVRLRHLGMGLEQALIMVGHEGRLKHTVDDPNALRPRAVGYSLLVGKPPSSKR